MRIGKEFHRCIWVMWKVKPADLWVGVYFEKRPAGYWLRDLGKVVEDLHLWICLLPCLPIHVVIPWRVEHES